MGNISEYNLDDIKKLPAKQAIDTLTNLIGQHPEIDEFYVIRGMKLWSLNKRKDALEDYHRALSLNPESSAKMLLEYSNSILNFYSKDLLNP